MKQRRSRRAILASCAAVVVAALGAAGCGGGDDDEDAASEAAKPVSLAITATSEGTAKALTFASSIEAGLVNMTLKNTDTVPRSAQLLRIVGNHSIADVVKVVTGDGEEIPTWIQDGGGVAAVAPGASATAAQVLAPGRYVLLDDEEGEGDDVKSYAELGAARELTITGERSRARLPARSATVTAEDAVEGRKHTYGFRLEGLKAGANQVHFQNTGLELHHALLRPAAKGRHDRAGRALPRVGPPAERPTPGRLREDRRHEGDRRRDRAEHHARPRRRPLCGDLLHQRP